MSAYALDLQNITKRFPGVVANDDVCLQVRARTVHAIVGENGAGKSTLMRVAYGMQRPDSGRVLVHGEKLGGAGTSGAIQLGVGMVHQHFMLVPTLRVAENALLGAEPRHGPWFDRSVARQRVLDTASRFGLRVDPDALVEDLSVGEQQRVEILKVLIRGARVLILDEPTAVLTPQEVEELFTILRRLVDQDRTVVLISHRLQEVLAHTDHITVMRDGRVVGDVATADASHEHLARLIVGREVESVSRRDVAAADTGSDIVLRCEGLCTEGLHEALQAISFEVRRGEILGFAGVEGNGQQALAHALLGLRRLTAGRIELKGVDVSRRSTAERRALGMAYVPADRLREALVEELRIDENAILGRQREPHLGRGLWLSTRSVFDAAQSLMRTFQVRPQVPELPAAVLSGGNQQRLVVGREFERNPVVLVLAQPTRGVDVGGIAFLHERILGARAAGCAIVLLSADLNEILALSDRVAVLFEGGIVGTTNTETASVAQLGLWMTGSREDLA
jgi:simple sugar transport system ATP-binding protein